ncbi:MAG: hypothetical protein ACLS59_08950 [Clostridia bacterium]
MKLRYTDCDKFYQYGFGENRHYTIVQIIPAQQNLVAVFEAEKDDPLGDILDDVLCLALVEFEDGSREIMSVVSCQEDGIQLAPTIGNYIDTRKKEE